MEKVNDQEKTIPVQQAAKTMGVTPLFLMLALQQGKFPFGSAIKMRQWVYYINAERFDKYMKGSI